MKAIKILNFKKVVSFFLVIILFFSQNSMMVFADVLKPKSTLNVSNNLDTNEKDKSNQNNSENSSELTTKDSSYEGDDNNSSVNFIEHQKVEAGSYTINQNGIYPFTGDWGEKYTLKLEESKSSKNILEKGLPTYEGSEEGYYYKQLDEKRQLSYRIYDYLLTRVGQNEYLDVREHQLYPADLYGVYDVVIHEKPEFFWGFNLVVEIDNQGMVRRIKYDTPFTPSELDGMKEKFEEGFEKAVRTIHSSFGKNPSKLEKLIKIHDYLVVNNHYGTAPCPEKVHSNPSHLGCKGMYIEHSAYGALVESPEYGVVCEGFSSAFTLLCQYFEIDTIYDSGFNSSRTNLHAWNYVKMDDNKWYIVDLTHDNAYMKRDGIVYKLFLSGMENSNFEFRHDKYLGSYINEAFKGQEYTIPEISEDSYIKFEVAYPDGSGVNRNIFTNFMDLLNDLEKRNLRGTHTIALMSDYTLTKEEIQRLKDYKTDNRQKFYIKSDFRKSGKLYTLKTDTNKIYFPMDIYLQNIIYEIESTYMQSNSIIVDNNVVSVKTERSIYLSEKDNNYKSKYNEAYITSGHWKNIVGACPKEDNSVENIHMGDIYITVQGAIIDNITLSKESTIKGNIDVKINKGSVIDNLVYGDEIYLNDEKNLSINISDATVNNFKQNNNLIVANTTIDVKNGNIENLVGPDVDPKCKITINIKENLDVKSILNFDNLVIENGKVLNVTDELNYNKTKSSKQGIVTLSGNSTLKLPRVISKIGSLRSIGELNRLLISKEEAFLSINEDQGPQGTQIIISYDTGLVAKNGDELIRYKNKDDINLNNFINEVNKRFDFYDDEATHSIKLFLARYPIKVVYKNEESYQCNSLYDALKYIERQVSENVREVKFCINENYEISEEDLIALKSYSTTRRNQKFVFTSENKDAILSTSNHLNFPISDTFLEIEFKNITLDFENKNIFASGNNLIMDETVKMTSRSNVDIYGGSLGKAVANSRLILDGGTFNNVYGGGASLNGIVTNNVNISLDKSVRVKRSVYGGAGVDITGSSKITGMTTINLLGGKVLGDVIGGGKNDKAHVFNKIIINYGGNSSNSATKLSNIYGLTKNLNTGVESNKINININTNAILDTIAGFNNLNLKSGVKLEVLKTLKYDAGLSCIEGKVKLNYGSSLRIPNTNNEQHRKIGKLESVGFNNSIYISKGRYLLIDGNTNPTIGSTLNISYYEGEPQLNDELVKFTRESLASISNENFKTDYHFSIVANDKSGFLYLSHKTYKVRLYKEPNILDRTDVVYENGEYVFTEPTKTKGKRFVKWRDLDDGRYYSVGDKINVNKDMSLEAEYEEIEEYAVTLKVNEIYYKTEYVEAGKQYTFEPAPPIPEKYFIGWENETGQSNNTYGLSRLIIDNINYMQPGTTITVNRDLTFDAEYRDEVKYDVDYGDENGKVHEVYYDGGVIKVPSVAPIGIKIPFGKIFGGFRVIFNGIGNLVGGIFNTIFRPGQAVTIKPGIHIEAEWVDELHVNLYNEDGTFNKTDKVGKGLEYIVPKAPNIEYKEFLYWKNIEHPNDIYMENDKITAETNLNLKPVYKNNKIISLCLDGKQPKYFANLSLALDKAENSATKAATFELLEDYALTDPDIEKLRDFSRNNVDFTIRGCNKNIKLRVEKSIKLPTDTKFENIVLKYVSNNNQVIYARGHKLEMGDNITMEGIGAPILVGGDNETNVDQSNIIVRSGTYIAIYGGGYSEYSVVNGDTTIELLGGVVSGDIYGGSQSTDLNNNLIKRGTTTIKLSGGTVGGVVSGTSKFLGYGNSNNVNIYLLGTKLEKGEVYGGYLDPELVSHNIGVTTITVEKDYELNNLLGFTKLIINQGKTLEVKNALSHIGGIQLTQSSGELCLNGNSKLIVPSTKYEEYRQVGWINSKGSNNKIIVNKGQYLSLISTKDDEIDSTKRVILDFKSPDTSKDISVLLKYPENKEKAKSKSFKKGPNIQRELVLKGDKENGVIYSDERNLIKIIDPNKKSLGFKTIKGAIESIKSYSPKGEYKISLLENYTLKDTDISALKDLKRSDVRFVITGLNETTNLKAELKVSSNIMLSTDTKFEDIVFDCGESNDYRIYARGHKLEMGKNIDIKETGAPILLGGEDKKDVNKSEIIVESGTYSNIYGGGYEEYSGVQGDITIKLLGGDVRGDIYAGSQDTGLISRGKTEIILSGGTVGGVVSGTSRHLVLDNSNDVNIYLKGTDLKNADVYGGYPQDKEESHNVGEAIINVDKDATLRKLLGFTKLNIEQNVRLEVKKVLNHKGGINATDDSGEVCLNGNSTLIAPASHDSSERQIGWLNAKGQNNKIFMYKDMYLSLTSRKDDTIENQIELGFKTNLDGAYIDGITKKTILLNYENNKEKAKLNLEKFKRGRYLPDDISIKSDEKDGSIYIIENGMHN